MSAEYTAKVIHTNEPYYISYGCYRYTDTIAIYKDGYIDSLVKVESSEDHAGYDDAVMKAISPRFKWFH